VVDYGDEDNLTLLGAIRTDDETEATYRQLEMVARGANCDVVKRYDGVKDYSTLKGIIKDNQEGFVVRFSNGDRMKIKGEEYLRLHKIMTEVSTKSIWEILSNGDDIELILKDVPDEFFDKVKEYVSELMFQYKTLENEYLRIYNTLSDLKDKRSEFAKRALMFKHPQLLFNIVDGKPYSNAIWQIIKPEYKKI